MEKIKTLAEARAGGEADAIRDAIARSRTITAAANALGISRAMLYRLMDQHGIKTRRVVE